MSLPHFTRPQPVADYAMDSASPVEIDTDWYWTTVAMSQLDQRIALIVKQLRTALHDASRLRRQQRSLNAEWEALFFHRDKLDEAYNKRRWNRAWLVTSSDGHIHAGQYCQTFQPRTTCTLLPQVSGWTLQEIVLAAGEKACDICYENYGGGVRELKRRCKTLEDLVKDRYVFEEQTGCWIWQGAPKDTGYGQVKVGGRSGRVMNAHQAVYELMIGAVPEGKELDHLCRNRMCVNPEHLEPVTHRENVLRGDSPTAMAAKASRCPKNHLYNAENTYWRPDGKGRGCRTCQGWTGATFSTLVDPLTEHEQAAKAAEKAAKATAAQAKAITTPTGDPLYAAPNFDHQGLNGDLIKTEIAANRRALEELKALAWYGTAHSDASNSIVTVCRMVLALAAKRGTTAHDELEALIVKAEKSVKRDGGVSLLKADAIRVLL